MSVCRDATLKIERANKHIADVEAAILAQKHTYTVAIEHHPETGAESLVHAFPDFEKSLLDLSLIVGDAIHNLHSALDFAWYSTIGRVLPDKMSDSTKFPVRRTRENLEGVLHGIKVDTRCEHLFNLIVRDIQPYQGGHNSVIWTLHDLDISDKHLLLLELAPRGYIKGVSVRDSGGEIHRGSTREAEGFHGRYIIDFESGLHVEEKGKLFVTITLPEAGSFDNLPVLEVLRPFSQFVSYTVKLLENVIC